MLSDNLEGCDRMAGGREVQEGLNKGNKEQHLAPDDQGAFELWCRRRLLRVPRTARRSNQSILKEISPE